MSESNTESQEKSEPLSMREFLEGTPPNTHEEVILTDNKYTSSLLTPEILLHCEDESCNGQRLFTSKSSKNVSSDAYSEFFLYYRCKNCERTVKEFALGAKLGVNSNVGKIFKYGEYPQFGPPTPAKVVSLLGKEQEYYFKGRRSENQGLGIAAFAYYRRVVENQKNKILDEIIKTVQKVDSTNQTLLTELNNAKKEVQFTKAVDSIKHGIPQVLLIDGHNPLTLLHKALSEGLHAGTDEECLEFATSIRIVLTEMVSRMDSALKDTAELKSAVNRILNKK